MEQVNSSRKTTLAICAAAITAMLYMCFVGVLEATAKATNSDQMVTAALMTLPVLFAVVLNVVVGVLTKYVRPKVLGIITLVFAVIGGFPCFLMGAEQKISTIKELEASGGVITSILYNNVWILFLAVCFTGVATAMITTILNTIIMQEYPEDKQFSVMGLQNAFGGYGAAAMSLIGGLIVSATDMVTPFYIPMFVVCIVLLIIFCKCCPKGHKVPRVAKVPKAEKPKLGAAPWFYVCYLTFYMCASMGFLVQYGMRVVMGFGYAESSPVITMLPVAALTLGATMGLFTGKMEDKFGNWVIVVGPCVALVGQLLSFFAPDGVIGVVLCYVAGAFVGAGLTLTLSSAIFGFVKTTPIQWSSFMTGLSTSLGNFVTLLYITFFVYNFGTGGSFMNIPLGGAALAPKFNVYAIPFVRDLIRSCSNAGNQAGPVIFTNCCILICIIIAAIIRAKIEDKQKNDMSFDISDFDDFGDDSDFDW